MDRPELWDVNNPHRYQAVVTVSSGGAAVDKETVPFGIRLMEWKPATGFWLNGNNVKLLGACMHSDGGAVGAAVPASIWERRLVALKELGVNAVRTAHNPMPPGVPRRVRPAGDDGDGGDRSTRGRRPSPTAGAGYNRIFNDWFKADTRDMVLRDRNHPSIVIWRAGNEIRDNVTAQAGIDRYLAMQNIFHELDGTRPGTFALFRPTATGVYGPGGIADQMDVVGQNYAEASLVAAYNQNPQRKVIGTENTHDVATWRAVLATIRLWRGSFCGWGLTTWARRTGRRSAGTTDCSTGRACRTRGRISGRAGGRPSRWWRWRGIIRRHRRRRRRRMRMR